jgi:pimeloyl-ACP methyl ester carboxylesterase
MTSSLHVAELGVGPRTIVLLHGFGGCGEAWLEVASILAIGARTLAYDLPGHGLSLDFAGNGTPKAAARAVLTDIAERGLGKVHLVGHSMGGAIATLIALSEPDKVASLTLLAPGGFGQEINAALLRRYAAAVDQDDILACLAAMSGAPEVSLARVADASHEMRKRPGQLQKLAEIVEIITRDDRQGIIPREQLDRLTMPVMVAWGTDDAVLPFTHADGLPARFHVHHVLEAGHMLVDEVPELVAEIVRRNMKRRRRTGRVRLAAAAAG